MPHAWRYPALTFPAGVLAVLLVMALAALARPELFHLVTELACVALGACTFLILFVTRSTIQNTMLYVIGAAFLASAVLNLMHVSTATGLWSGAHAQELPERLWLASRGVLAVSALVAPVLCRTRLGLGAVSLGVVFLAGLLTAGLPWRAGDSAAWVQAVMNASPLLHAVCLAGGLAQCRLGGCVLERPTRAALCTSFGLLLGAELLFGLRPLFGINASAVGRLLMVAGFAYGCRAFAVRAFADVEALLRGMLREREEHLAAQNARLSAQSAAVVRLSGDRSLNEGDLDDALARIAETAVPVLEAHRAAVWLFSPDRETLACRGAFVAAPGAPAVCDTLRVADHGVFLHALENRRVCTSRDAGADPCFGPAVAAVLGQDRPVSFMAAGVRLGGALAGLCCVARMETGHAWHVDQEMFLGTLADLTALALESHDRMRDQRARRESEERLNALIEAIPDHVCFKDDQGRWLVANRARLLDFGLEGVDYVGRTDAELAHLQKPGGCEMDLSLVTDALARRVGHLEYCLANTYPGGDGKAYDVVKKALAGPDGRLKGLMVLGRDVTTYRAALDELRAAMARRKHDQEALAARQVEIEALNRGLEHRVAEAVEESRRKDLLLLHQSRLAAMGEMIGNIAHQWRQPLNALSLLVANLAWDAKNGPVSEAETDLMYRQCHDILNAMSRTIDDFRNFFKPDKQVEAFDVGDTVREALRLVEASLKTHRIEVELDLPECPPVLGYRGEYSQVILNLLANARDAVQGTRGRGGRIRVSAACRDGHVDVHVEDDGGGMSQEVARHLFEPYYSTKPQDKGTGLGLYMSRQIIEGHMMGKILAENTETGAVFTVSVPVAPPGDAASREEA